MNDQAKTLGSITGVGSAAQCSQSTWPNKIQPHMAHQVAMTAAEAAARAQQFPSENIGIHVAQVYLQAYEAVEGWTKKQTPQPETPKKSPQVSLHPGDTVVLHNKCTGKRMSVRLADSGLSYVWDAGDTGGRVRENA